MICVFSLQLPATCWPGAGEPVCTRSSSRVEGICAFCSTGGSSAAMTAVRNSAAQIYRQQAPEGLRALLLPWPQRLARTPLITLSKGAPKVGRSVCFLLGNSMCPEVESYGALISFKGLVYSQASCQIPHQPIKIKNAKAGDCASLIIPALGRRSQAG